VDFAVADTIRSLVESPTRNFIWVTKEGAHVPYFRRAPASHAIWTPQWTSGSWDPARKQEIINAYDNAVRYNLDGFFRRLFPGSEIPKDTVFVYTADHGESLAEQGEAVAHCGVGRQEAIVPLVMFGYGGPPVDTNYRASHQNLFPTLLDLMGVPEASRTRAYERSLLRATAGDSQPRFFYAVDLGQLRPKARFD
jgi:lipid A ethanolaminephosphotransferase